MSDIKAKIESQSQDWSPSYFQQLAQDLDSPVLANYLDTLDFDQIDKLELAVVNKINPLATLGSH